MYTVSYKYMHSYIMFFTTTTRLQLYAKNSLIIHLRPLLLHQGHVCEYERQHLQSSPRDPVSQTMTLHSYSQRHSHHHHHPTQNESVRVHHDLPLIRLHARLGGVGAAAAAAADDDDDRCCCVAIRPTEQQSVIRSRQ